MRVYWTNVLINPKVSMDVRFASFTDQLAFRKLTKLGISCWPRRRVIAIGGHLRNWQRSGPSISGQPRGNLRPKAC